MLDIARTNAHTLQLPHASETPWHRNSAERFGDQVYHTLLIRVLLKMWWWHSAAGAVCTAL